MKKKICAAQWAMWLGKDFTYLLFTTNSVAGEKLSICVSVC